MIELNKNTEVSNSVNFRQDMATSLNKHFVNKQTFNALEHFPIINGKQALLIMDWKQSKISYSKGVEEMFGYHSDEFCIDAALNFIHPDDLKMVSRIIQGNVKYCAATTILSANQYLNMTFRALKKDGSYIRVLRQSSPYQLDDDGKFTSNLTFLTDISFMKTNDNKVEWSVFSDDMDVSKFKENIYKEFVGFFTPREMEIVYLIQNNFTNKKIASQLVISVYTVKTHRKNIFKKSNTHNATELLVFCELNGII